MSQPVALFTAAGSGIGAAAARKLASDAWAVAILSPSGRGAALAEELGGLGITGSNLEAADLQRPVTPLLQQRQHGAIVNVSSYATFEPEAAFPTSGVCRAGLTAFAKLYADRYAADGLCMNNVLPGFIDSLPEHSERRERIPMGRCGRADEVAELIAFLASDQSSHIAGKNIRSDGGLTRSV